MPARPTTSTRHRASPSKLTLRVPPGFDLPRAVCSYGYFLLAPNLWEPASKTLYRPLRGRRDRVINVRITMRSPGVLRLDCDRSVDRVEACRIRADVTRMLRVDEDLWSWNRLHPVARRARFGRLFRSPSFFEDVVKTMTGCNVTWPNTMRMNELLCKHIGHGAFPTPGQLAAVRPATLKRHCKVGYRAERIVRVARDVHKGRLDPAWFEDPAHDSEQVYQALREVYGIGDYAASNLCHLLGHYDRVAIDTETYRHFRQQHGLESGNGTPSAQLDQKIRDHYDRYAPYQFLSYWFDLWRGYESRFGDARLWSPQVHGPNFTSSVLRNTPGVTEKGKH